MKSHRVVFMLALALTMLFVSSAQAHDMWLEKKGSIVELLYGHPGNTDPYPLDRITAINGITENLWRVKLAPVYRKGEAFCHVNDNYPMITVDFDNRYWYHTKEDGWHNFEAPRQVVGKIVEEGASYKLSKEIVAWKPFMAKPVGQRAEIVPLKDPTNLKEGEMLPIQLFFEGKVMQPEGSRTSLTSDPKNEHPKLVYRKNLEPVQVKVGPPGRQIIIGKYAKKVAGEKWVWFAFSLTFKTNK
jgi:nickel transport protein